MSKDVTDYSPQEYAHIYRQLNAKYRSSFNAERQELSTIKQSAQSEISALKIDLTNVRQQYIIGSYGSAIVYIDHLECGNSVINFNEPYAVEPYSTKIREIYGYYKNGKPRTHLVKYSFARFISSKYTIDITAGNTKTEAKQLINNLKQKIAANATKKPELDQQVAEIEQKIQAAEAKLADDLATAKEHHQDQRQKYTNAIDRLISSGTSTQYRHLFRPSRLILLACSLLPGLAILLCSLSGYSTFFKTIAESNYDYDIVVNDEITLDCNLNYDSAKHYFYCEQQKYTSRVSKTESTDFTNNNGKLSPTASDTFTAVTPLQIIPSSKWAIEDISFNKTAEAFSKSSDKLSLYNAFLRSTVAQKEVHINWNFSQEDKDLMRKVWSEWKTEQENKARKQLAAEIKAKEEAAKKAAEEAAKKAAEEAAKKAAEEAAKEAARIKAAEEARKSQNSITPNPSTPNTTGPNNGSGQQSGVRTGAVCNDGTSSTATGRGACSRHGGVRYWTY